MLKLKEGIIEERLKVQDSHCKPWSHIRKGWSGMLKKWVAFLVWARKKKPLDSRPSLYGNVESEPRRNVTNRAEQHTITVEKALTNVGMTSHFLEHFDFPLCCLVETRRSWPFSVWTDVDDLRSILLPSLLVYASSHRTTDSSAAILRQISARWQRKKSVCYFWWLKNQNSTGYSTTSPNWTWAMLHVRKKGKQYSTKEWGTCM